MRLAIVCFVVVLGGCTTDDAPPEKPTTGIRDGGESPETAVLHVVSMMHAEESVPFHTAEIVFRNHADNLRAVAGLLRSHGAKVDFGPDWTFIEGVKAFDSTLLTDLVADGHGLHTHAHETQFELGAVHAKLLEAGVAENHVANGGFTKKGSGGTNWVGYHASIESSVGERLFQVAIGHKDVATQTVEPIDHAFRPSTGDWHQHDPDGPIIYLGANMPSIEKGGAIDFSTIRDWIDGRLELLDPTKINTLYWHDSLHGYPSGLASERRMQEWEALLTEYFDPLVAEGKIRWVTFAEMGEIYAEWEERGD